MEIHYQFEYAKYKQLEVKKKQLLFHDTVLKSVRTYGLQLYG